MAIDDASRDPWPFSPTVEKDGDFDIWHPLARRWIRFWPWRYGGQRKDVHLDVAVQNAPEMSEAARRDHAENIRLLYVGMTRAKDYLVLAPRISSKGFPNVGWLRGLTDAAGDAVIDVSDTLDTGVKRTICGARSITMVRCLMFSPQNEEIAALR